MGGLLNGEFASLHLLPPLRVWLAGDNGGAGCWTGSFAFPAPLASDFWPGAEALAEGQVAGQGVCLLCASRSRLQACLRDGGGGRCAGRKVCFSAPFVSHFESGLLAITAGRAAGRGVSGL